MRDALSPHHSVKVDAHALERLIEEQRKGYKSRFLVKQGSTLKSVSTGDVAYFYSEDKLVFLKTTQSHKYVLNQSLDELEQMLDPERFFRISRQYIVNFDSIQKVHPHFKGRLKVELVPPASDDVYISSRRASPFKEWMDL
jgi:DNA-binding LytR/AlgR family response regulator